LRELALHLLDIAENSISAHASEITITVMEDSTADRLSMSVQDNGAGMDAQMVARVTDPFVTSRTTRKVGLGIPLLKAAAEACNGYLRITSQLGAGTLVEVEFQRSHIDRMPLGDLAGTLLSLVIGSPQVHWIFHYQVDSRQFIFDDAPLKVELVDIPFTDPAVLAYIRETLSSGVTELQLQPA
jgi:hypothetical protein